MHPAPSIIAFSTFSGLGLGLLFWLGVDNTAPTGWVAFAFFAIAYILAVGGLISSTFHLGRPERAVKAFTQWQTSWLSREAWSAVAALVIMGLYGFFLVFFERQIAVLGWIGAFFSLLTVYTTSMIYAQLKTVPRWNTILTSVLFVSLSIAGGALISGRVTIGLIFLLVAGGIQAIWWKTGDARFKQSGTDLKSATGLGKIGEVRAFEPPHTGTNYLLNEMVYTVGRKHAQKLRMISFLLMLVVPVFLLLLPYPHVFGVLALISHIAGVLVSRWLFFAEAEHVVGLYYGMR
ncbi:DmsC/YnfH family molybdoenzyme membrane anchor subunit [Marivita sp. XM-24bin2]|jgi:DMSO reductase anchor subunit|uniref:dimethyl sulfoxide reductase anchor subunit family protein n=1 Tax=unclassified Marivita TaxID=2632480 RepID=UPI000D7A6DAA|nr:DmsC/YnfH family molybdoenzyme membrane anchor subunit [Marivita sp. XM-24bin2]MCR9109605.1 dimethyl sulfoxide reductase anchor subunit [Paracoccaceae bacterium]PWL36198.1 MAG: dibenzothiophene desulfurase [Marivita sp. XM-24bin2]